MPRLSNEQHERFCRFYATEPNGQKASELAGLSPTTGSKLLQRREVVWRIQELSDRNLKAADITAQRVILELGRIAFSDIRDVFDERGNLLPPHEMSDDAAASLAAIKGDKVTRRKVAVPRLDLVSGEQERDPATGEPLFDEVIEETRTVEVRRYDKVPALTVLAKHFKVIGDEGDGVNALASALADRLKTARKRARTPQPPVQLEGPAE